MQTKTFDLKKLVRSNGLRLAAMILLLYVVSGLLMPSYFKFSHIMSVLVLSCFLGIISIGQTYVVISGGADLSVAYTVTFTACIFAQVTKFSGSGIVGLLATLGCAILVGLLKGFGVAILKIPSMVMTLATNSILMSVTYLYTGGVLKGESTPFVTALAKNSVLGIRLCVLAWIVLGVISILVLKKTRFGRSIYAVGSSLRVAKLSGINTNLVLIGVYVYASVMMSLCGILLIGYLGYPNYTMADGYQLISIASVVIGGTSILGGQGGYLGSMCGVVIIYLIESILIVLNMAEAGREIVYGAVILIILLAYGRGAKKRV